MQVAINAMADVPRTEFRADWRITSGNCANCGNSRRRRKPDSGLGKLFVHQLQRLGREGPHVGDTVIRARAQVARDLALGADDGDPGVAGRISVGVDVVRWLIENALMWLSPPAALDTYLSISSVA